MDEHKHIFWKRYIAGRRRAELYPEGRSMGRYVVPDGAECGCGAIVSEDRVREWYTDETIRESFGKWASKGPLTWAR